MVNRRHAGGRKEVHRDSQRRGDTKKKKKKASKMAWIKEGNQRWKRWGQ